MKNIALIGASGSIGYSLASFLSKQDNKYNLITLDLPTKDNLSLLDDLDSKFIPINLLDNISIEEGINQVLINFDKKLDGLIFNAAQTTEGLIKKFSKIPPYSEFPLSIWQEGIQINLTSFNQIMQHLDNYLTNAGSGKIIAVSSIYGVVAPDFNVYEDLDFYCPAVYSASKAGLIGLVKWLGSYYGRYGINVNSISPGGVFNNQAKEFVNRIEQKIPLSRMADKEDFNGIIEFLLSDKSNYVNGQNFIIDGGYSIR